MQEFEGIKAVRDFENLIARTRMKVVTFDLEIANDVDSVGGWGNTHRMGVSTIVCYDHSRSEFLICDDKDYENAKKLIESADVIVGFNQKSFDYPVLYGIPKSEAKAPTIGTWVDFSEMVWSALGRRENGWKLDQIGEATLGIGKNDDGALAPEMFKKGLWGRLINYCVQDVVLTIKVAKFAAKNGYIFGAGKKRLNLDWSRFSHETREAILGAKIDVTEKVMS